MTLKAYYDTILAKTGKTPKDFISLAEQKGFLKEGVKPGQIVAWLKQDYGLGQGHAMSIVLAIKNSTQPRPSESEKVGLLFRDARAKWREPYQALLDRVREFGPDVSEDPTDSYISLLRAGRKFAIVQVTSNRMDVGIKHKGRQTTSRFKPAGSWNSMVTHRVQLTDADQIDSELVEWLKQAYEAA